MAATANASGVAVDSIGPCPEGYCWYLNNETIHSNTSASSPTFELYVSRTNAAPNDSSKAGRVDYTTGSNIKDAANNLASPIYVGPGMYLVGVWNGLNNNDVVNWSGQILSHKLEVHQVRYHGIEYADNDKQPHAVVTPDQIAAV